MAQDNELNPDPNENAARIVGESASRGDLPADLETAWLPWPAWSEDRRTRHDAATGRF